MSALFFLMRKFTYFRQTLAKYCALALKHFALFKHCVATPT
jgi:hypothetical protein